MKVSVVFARVEVGRVQREPDGTSTLIAIALFVMIAVISTLRGDWRTASGAATGAVVLGLLALISSGEAHDDRRRDC
jgi:hypothetical protein